MLADAREASLRYGIGAAQDYAKTVKFMKKPAN